MSPYADLTLAGATLDTKREADPQAGTHEVLLDDAIRLARQAAIADVRVTLDITAGVPDVFQNFHAMLDEGTAALDRAGQFLSAQLASAEHVTA
jgi:acetyl esterase/lipase